MIQTPTVGGRTDAILDFKGITECVKNRASTARWRESLPRVEDTLYFPSIQSLVQLRGVE